VLISANSALNQSGTQSDITLPNPMEINPLPVPSSNQTTGNQSAPSSLGSINVDRTAFEIAFQQASFGQAVQMFEELQAVEFGKQLGLNLFGKTASAEEISQSLCELSGTTGKKAAILYAISLENQLNLLLILPQTTPCSKTNSKQNTSPRFVRRSILEANRSIWQQTAREFRRGITDPSLTDNYQLPGKQLYNWIIQPLQSELYANKIDTLVFCLDNGLRSLPIAAFYTGDKFLIEQYNLALIPSFSLTDTRYASIIKSLMLGMGISQSTEEQTALPAVAVEVPTLTEVIWRGQDFLNEEATLEKLESVAAKQRFGIIHIATHAEFKPGKINESYIQFWNSKLRLQQLNELSRKLKWNRTPKVEMLVLSACRTALGNEQAELGFAGLAVQAGVKTAVGSLWYASDQGSLALMTEFYSQLQTAPIKTAAMRQAQLAMLKGQVRFENAQLVLSDNRHIPLPSKIAPPGKITLSHPFFWSGYTMIGNWN